MSVIAVYNMKGGVGKTTTSVNLAYLSAASGERTLLWDLDPQGASSFAFRVRPHVAGFSKKTLASGHELAAAIKGTDHDGLDLLPADFAYRKLDRLLGRLGRPEPTVVGLLAALGRDYDTVLLDCPPGVSLLTEGVFAASDLVLVPTIPTVLSLRTLAQLITWAGRCNTPPQLAAFFSMVDCRKALHRRVVEWATRHPGVFLAGQVPYASVVEEMAVRRLPLPVFAAQEPAARASAAILAEVHARLGHADQRSTPGSRVSRQHVAAIESLIAGLDGGKRMSANIPLLEGEPPAGIDARFVHRFDTDDRDLERHGYLLELREQSGRFLLVAARSALDDVDGSSDPTTQAQVQIDRRWGQEILSGVRSPLSALERRLCQPLPGLLHHLRTSVGERRLQRTGSRLAGRTWADAAVPDVGAGVSPTVDSRDLGR